MAPLVDPNMHEAYQKMRFERRIYDVNRACIIALFIIPLGMALDYVMYPEYFRDFLMIRIGSVLGLGCLYLLNVFPNTKQYSTLNAFLWPIIINLSICQMMNHASEITSPYYAGMSLVVIGTTTMLAFNLLEAAVIFGATMLMYGIYIWLQLDQIDELKLVFSNLFFLTLTGLVGCAMSFFGERRRLTEFSLQYQLDQRNQELANLDRMKSDFFANISHELRTPLTLILSPIQDILNSQTPLDFKITRSLTTVQDNAFRLLKLVNDLLNLMRLDEKDSQMDNSPIAVLDVLRSVAKSMEHIARKQQIDLVLNFGLEAPLVLGNSSALEKIFVNLLNNAIKFTPSGGTITLSSEKHRDTMTIKLADTGIGISESDLPFIFDRFKQADSSTTRKYQGTGLGLALVKELMRSQNGTIDIQSEIGEGTAISLTLPLASRSSLNYRIPDKQLPPPAREAMSPLEAIHHEADYSLQLNIPDTQVIEPHSLAKVEDEPENNGRPLLLIVDDEPDLRSYLVNLFSDEFNIISATDGELGLGMALKHQPDLVLLDLMLPKMDGLTVCANIKASDALKFSKVILLTARIDEKSKLAALESGADDFLTKPFSTIEIKTRLRNLWRSAQLERGLKQQNMQLEQTLVDLKALESKLIHSEKINALGGLAAGLLHEVNNPLNYSITAVQMLKREPVIAANPDITEMINDAYEGMERIRMIVRDLHAFAYPSEADRQESFNLRKAIESAMRFTATEWKLAKLVLDVEDSINVTGSFSHIVQVLINLLTNASKALHGAESPEISIVAAAVTRKTDDKAEQRIQVRVRDNGSGIEEHALQRIFEPFYTTRDVGEGLGMGLSICYTIIKNHGGELEVSSDVGKFTEFSFDLATLASAQERAENDADIGQ